MNATTPPSTSADRMAVARPPRVWPVLVIGGLLGGAGLVRMIVGLVRMAGPAREDFERSVEHTFSLAPIVTFVGIKSAILLVISLVAALASGQRAMERLRVGPSAMTAAQLVLGTVATYCLGSAGYAAASLLGATRWSQLPSSDEAMNALPTWAFLVLLVTFALGGAIEEVFYRGFLQTRLRERWGRWPAIVVTATAFGLAHGDVVHSTLMVLMGILLGWLVELRGSIRPAIVAHVGNNVLSSITTLLLPEGSASRARHATVLAIGLAVTALCLVPLRAAGRSTP